MNSKENSDVLDLERLINIILDNKIIIILTTFIFGTSSIIISLLLTPIYQSEALLEPNPRLQQATNLNQFSGAASVMGLDLSPSSGGADIVTVSIETIRSKDFFSNLTEDQSFLIELMAFKKFNIKTQEIFYDNTKYNFEDSSWIIDGESQKPTFHDSYETFIKNHLSVETDSITKLTKVSISHPSPKVAKKWADMIILKINNIMRDKKLDELNKSVLFLKNELNKTNVNELKVAISESIERELNSLMYAKITEDYIFKVIDKPRVATVQSAPKKKNIVVISTIIGFILSVLICIIIEFISVFNARRSSQS
tara:strand:+ start:9067 stop:9999 length:933 start_codon:yes stop_codon:yes gene_type:complete